MKVVVALTCFLFVTTCAYASSVCLLDDDCPGHNETLFCGSPICLSGTCTPSPSPCSQVCSESLRRCVECQTASDCPLDGQICSSTNNTCRWCSKNADCPMGAWCQGGQLLCASERCVVPSTSMWPCERPTSCSEEHHNCNRCDTDSDCSDDPYDWCTNRVYCNVTLHQCVHEEPLPSPCRVCNSERRECLECETDAQCRTTEWQLSQPFCTPPSAVAQCIDEACVIAPVTEASMLDYWQLPCPQDTTDIAYVCNEQQKQCIQHLSDEQLPSLIDGVKMSNTISLSVYMARLQETPIACQRNSDCKRLGWICRTISAFDPSERACIPCHSDPQCITDTGYGMCNTTIGSCINTVSDETVTVIIPQVTARDTGLINLAHIQNDTERAIVYQIKTWPTTLEGEWEGLGDTWTFQLIMMCLLVVTAAGSIVILTLYTQRRACFRRRPDKPRKRTKKPQQQQQSKTSVNQMAVSSSRPQRLSVAKPKSPLDTVFEDF